MQDVIFLMRILYRSSLPSEKTSKAARHKMHFFFSAAIP